MDVIERLKELMEERHWSEYRLVKQSGLPASTVSNIFHRHTNPSIHTLTAICNALGITLAEFFDTGHKEDVLSAEQKEILKLFYMLNAEQRRTLKAFMYTLKP